MTDQKAPSLPGWWDRRVGRFEDWGNFFFDMRSGRRAGLLRLVVLAGFYLVGIYLWGIFFSWGNISFDFLDWAEVTGPRYALLQDAARTNQFPLHAADPSGLRSVTDRYLSIADTPLSPQFYLLRYLSMGAFTFWNTILFYTLGYLGLLLLYRKYRLSLWVFAILFLLFSFNGSMTTHIAVGHANWSAQYLLPYFIYLVLGLLERGRASWNWMLGLAGTLVLILLQGHFHLYVWCLLFLGFLAIFNPRILRPVLLGILFTILISLPRLLPPALVLQSITHKYLGGFTSLLDLVNGLAALRDPDLVAGLFPTSIFPLNGWELDFYLGLAGALLVAWYGLYLPASEHIRLLDSRAKVSITGVLLPCAAMVILSLGNAFELLVKVLPVPPLTGERVTSRILIVPLSFLLVLAAVYLQRWLNTAAQNRPQGRLNGWMIWGLVGLALIIFHDLNRHLQAWGIRYLDQLVYLFPKVPFNPAQHMVGNHADPTYTNLMLAGLFVSGLTLTVVMVMAVRSRKST